MRQKLVQQVEQETKFFRQGIRLLHVKLHLSFLSEHLKHYKQKLKPDKAIELQDEFQVCHQPSLF